MKETIGQALGIVAIALVAWVFIEIGQQVFAPRLYAFDADDSRVVHVTQRRWLYPDKTWTMHARFNQELKAWTWQIEYAKGQWCDAFHEPDSRPED